MPRRELYVLRILRLLLLLLGRLRLAVLLKVVHCQLRNDQEARLFIRRIFLTQLESGLLEIGRQVADDVRQANQDGGAIPVLHHGAEVILHVATFHDFFGASEI